MSAARRRKKAAKKARVLYAGGVMSVAMKEWIVLQMHALASIRAAFVVTEAIVDGTFKPTDVKP